MGCLAGHPDTWTRGPSIATATRTEAVPTGPKGWALWTAGSKGAPADMHSETLSQLC